MIILFSNKMLLLSDDNELEELRREYLHYINVVLPSISSKNKNYPIQLNHCWARVILDRVCKDKWSNVLKKPAYKNMNKVMLKEAIKTALALSQSPLLAVYLNNESLKYRNKLRNKE